MVTSNRERTAKLSAGINRMSGEAFTFVPRMAQDDVDLPAVADQARQSFTATGAWSAGGRTSHLHARGHADSNAQAAVASPPSVTFDEADLAWLPAQNDLCRRELDGSVYAISKTIPDGLGRVKFMLTAKKR